VLGRLALIGSAIAFARSARGKQAIAQARTRYDTPENRAKISDAVAGLRQGKTPSLGRHA